MSPVATKKLLFILADDQDRCYYVQNGVVKKMAPGSIPGIAPWVKHNPEGWKDITLQFATNQKYFSTLRQFTNALTFVEDGKLIVADRMLNGAGTEEVMYLIMLRQDPSMGLNGYKLEYKSRVDLSKFVGDTRKGCTVNMLQDDVFALVQANETANYPLPCNSSNPAAIKVLFDGVLMQDKLNYQVVNVPIVNNTGNFWWAVPLTFINNEGDSVGTTFNSQNYDNFSSPNTYVAYPGNSNNAVSFNEPTTVHIKGTYSFTWTTNTLPSGQFSLMFLTSLQTLPAPHRQVIFSNGTAGGNPPFNLVPGQTYTVNIDLTMNLAANEKLFLLMNIADSTARAMTIKPLSTTISIIFSSKQTPSIAYGLRPLDVLKQLVTLITQGQFTADSKFLASNNRKVFFSGSSLRSFPDALLQISFSTFFKALTSAYNLGVTVRNGVLYVEPIGSIYNNNRQLMDLGNISEAKLTVAQEYIYTSAKVGYTKQTYNKRNGRYEYNCTHTYKFPINAVLNTLDLVSPVRADCFGAEFIRTGYPNLNSTDDKGDSDLFAIMISDTVGQTEGEISTAFAITVETLIVAAPVIKTPYSNTVVYNQNPTITGKAQPVRTITVYVDGFADGTTVSDVNGNWIYQIQAPLQSLSTNSSGVHVIEATAESSPLNVSGFSNVLTITVNTSIQSSFLFTSPTNNDTLYNNLPLITGIAPSGKVITIKVDGVAITTVTANSSGLWSFQVVAPLSDAVHLLEATAAGLPAAPPVTITVNKNVATPLITSVVYGEIIYNNLPLIKGVAIPGTVVPVYLDGGGGPIVSGVAGPVGTATADANGDWSFQVVTVVDSSGFTTPYIPDGLHILSTTATPVNVLAQISGFRLMRGSNKGPVMDYDAIKLDDQYIPVGLDPTSLPATLGQFLHPETLYNIEETTPLRMLRAHDNILNGFLRQQAGETITFNGAEVNANLVTKKNGVIFNEGAGVDVNDLSAALFWNFYLNFKAKVPFTFNDIMTSINNDGYIKTSFNGTTIYCLPIGTMSMKPATDEAQNFKLLVSSKTPLLSLMQLFSNGTTINLGKNMIYLSDKNPLHFVKYNYQVPAGFHFKDIYDDWQKNRFPRWQSYRPDYAQPFQNSDTINLQAVTNGVGVAQVQMISVATGRQVNFFSFAPVAGSLVQLPNILQQVSIPLTGYSSGQYWFALFVDGAIVAISEKIWLKADWPNTMVFDYGGSEDKIDYYFSTGIQPRIRVQAEWLPWDPTSEVDNYEDEGGDYEMTRAIALKTRVLQLGSEESLLSDWMSIKMNNITLLTNCLAEGTHYTRTNNSKWEKEDFGQGVPEVMIKMEMTLAENQNGVTFATPGDSNLNNIDYTLDALAFGQNAGVIKVTAQ
jgi:hypothetical protein